MNHPIIQPSVAMGGEVFTPEECAAVCAMTADEKVEVFDSNDESVGRQTAIRDGYSRAISDTPETRWLFLKLQPHVMDMNQKYYGFDLSEIILQLGRYERGHFYDWHMDTLHDGDLSRKLSFTVQLSSDADYEGGEVEFLLGPNTKVAPKGQGQIIFFPSFVLHRVRPVSKGCRMSLVGWVYGPHFR